MSTLFSDLFLKGSGVATPERRLYYFTSSSTFVASNDMDVSIDAIGPGGSGALLGGSSLPGNASGGGAGGHVKKKVSLKAGDTLTITIGAAGGAITGDAGNPSTKSANGIDGGNTTVIGPNVSLTAGGGKGGVQTVLNAACLGGLGGTASGGDVNLPGGRGGNISSAPATTAGFRATGGGAVDLGLGAFHGGDLLGNTVLATANVAQATPGAGNGAHGTSSTTADNGLWYANGGGPGAFTTNLSAAITLIDRAILGIVNVVGPVTAPQVNGSPSNMVAPGPLSGSSSAATTSPSTPASVATAGAFSGGGGAASGQTNTGSYANVAGDGGSYGGGGGGCCAYTYNVNSNTRSGGGGGSIVVLEIL